MAITKIGTKLIGDGTITTVKLGTSAVTRTDIQSGSVQVTHLDVTQGAGGHVDFLDDDFLIAGDATDSSAKSFSFSQLKTALSLSNAARGDEGTVQFNNGSGFDGISKIRSDGVHLTASAGGKIVLAFTDISGSTGEIFADSKTGLTLSAKTRLSLHSSGTVQGNQSGSVELRADGLFPSPKPQVAAQPGTFRIQFTSGSIGPQSSGNPKTYGPLQQYNAQMVSVLSTGSGASLGKEWYLFYLNQASSPSPIPVSASLNLEFNDAAPGKRRHDISVEAVSGVTDWRDVVANIYTAMNTELDTNADVATVALSTAANISATASITVTYKAGTMRGAVAVGTGGQGISPNGSGFGRGTAASGLSPSSPFEETPPSNNPAPIEGQFQQDNHDYKQSGEPDTSGGEMIVVASGSTAQDRDEVWLNLGASSRKYNEVYASVISGSGTAQLHKVDADEVTANRIVQSTKETELSGSGTASLHNLSVEEGTFGGVKFSSVRDSAAYAATGSGTANLHKIDADLGTIDRVSALVVTGSGVSQIHKIDADLGTIDRVSSLVVTGSGTSLFHKLDVDEGDFRKVISTNVTSSGLAQLHNMVASDVSGAVGEFNQLNVDHLNARVINSTTDTVEHFEVNVKQLIPAVSQSAGASQEGAGLQIGGTAGSGSAGIASVILGDAGSGAGADLLFKVGSVQGASLSGSANEPLQRFGVSGSISGSIGVFHEITINKSMGAQDSIFSGSSLNAHLLSGSTGNAHFVDVNRAEVADISGSTMTYHTITGSEVNAHRVTGDVVLIADVSGSNAVYQTLSGSTLTANLLDADRLTADVDVAGAISGSALSTLHKLTSDNLSGSHIQVHGLGQDDRIDNLVVKDLQGDDVIKKASLNNDIVKNNSGIHGGIVFNNGQLSVGWKRRIFSRSTKKLVNRAQPTQGSGSLYTTCSLSEIRVLSGSEMVYFNGLLLAKSNANQATYKKDGDYRIDYNSGGGLQPGSFVLRFTSGSTNSTVTGKASGGSNTQNNTYAPITNGNAQLVIVESTGSQSYIFHLADGGSSPLPVSASINLNFSDLNPGKKRFDIPVEARAGINDWRDVVTNLKNKMIGELQHSASLATISYSPAANINATASITVTYDAGTTEGNVQIGTGFTRSGNSGKFTSTFSSELFPASNFPAPLESRLQAGQNHDYKASGIPDVSGGEVTIATSGSTLIAGTEIFLSENLAMDSDDVLVVQYLSGSHRFG